MGKRVDCKGYNRITGKRCESWAKQDGYCRPHALRAREEARITAERREPRHLATCPIGSIDWADCCCGDAF
jgi:hypothetical protein